FTQTTSSFPFLAPSGSYSQSSYGGNGANRFGDAFFSVLNPNGSLKYSSYLGGQSGDEGFALASLRRGLGNNIFTGGNTRSSNFPIPSGQSNLLYVNNLLGNANDTYKDGYIASFDKDLSLKWSTYIGGGSHIAGNGEDEILSASCHELNVYFIGNTNSSDFKPVRDFSNIFNGGVNDGFILKFQMEGTPLSIKKQLTNNEKGFLVYPVPAQDFLILDLDKRFGNEIEFLNLFNFCGKQIENVNFDEQNSKLNLENLENGFYLLSIKIKGNSEISRVKFVINK
ncbi:MAG: T9SS type A sorting domain-containing protein, partial [Bacteroidia bacterium]|nr:T9SS type A sorting domain-containing protein [Bacteroidia bacterium]